MKWITAALLGLTVFTAGCGGSTPPPSTTSPVEEKIVGAKEDVKKMLQGIAESGSGGSGLMGVKESIEKAIRPSDAKLADDLMKDFDQLSQTQDPQKVKEIATRMAGKL